jgi:glycosyltransferase involved in cell wall biosynthesis
VSQPNPRVSVIVPAYGVAHLVGDALRSLRAQSFADWEAIVIDDGSPDDVGGACAPIASDPRVRVMLTDNRGVASARNRAIAAARAPYLA